MINISTSAVGSHHTQDHGLTEKDWKKVVLSVNNPIYITKHKNGSFKVYTPILKDGKEIMVALEIGTRGKDVEISKVKTAFPRSIKKIAATGEIVIYNRKKDKKRIMEKHSLGNNSQLYSTVDSLYGSKDNNNNEYTNNSEEKLFSKDIHTPNRDSETVIPRPDTDDIRFSVNVPTNAKTAQEAYEKAVLDRWNRFQYEFQDRQQYVRAAMEAIMQATGRRDIADNENYLAVENHMSSIADAEKEIFVRDYYQPLVKEVNAMIDRLLKDRRAVAHYKLIIKDLDITAP